MKKLNIIYISLLMSFILMNSCESNHLQGEKYINSYQIIEQQNNAFQVYEGTPEYESLKSDKSLSYDTRVTYAITDESERDSLFVEKAIARIDSFYYKFDSLNNLHIYYQYYQSSPEKLIPILINHNNHLTIRCKRESYAELIFEDEKYVIKTLYSMIYTKFELSISIPRKKIQGKNIVVFEPLENKSYVVYLSTVHDSL